MASKACEEALPLRLGYGGRGCYVGNLNGEESKGAQWTEAEHLQIIQTGDNLRSVSDRGIKGSNCHKGAV